MGWPSQNKVPTSAATQALPCLGFSPLSHPGGVKGERL